MWDQKFEFEFGAKKIIWIWRQKSYLNSAPKLWIWIWRQKFEFEFNAKNLNLNLAPKTWIWIWRKKIEFEFGALTLAGLLRDEACVCYFIERKPSKEGRQSDFDSSCSFWERKHFFGGRAGGESKFSLRQVCERQLIRWDVIWIFLVWLDWETNSWNMPSIKLTRVVQFVWLFIVWQHRSRHLFLAVGGSFLNEFYKQAHCSIALWTLYQKCFECKSLQWRVRPEIRVKVMWHKMAPLPKICFSSICGWTIKLRVLESQPTL